MLSGSADRFVRAGPGVAWNLYPLGGPAWLSKQIKEFFRKKNASVNSENEGQGIMKKVAPLAS